LRTHISPHEYCGIIVFIFVTIIQSFNFYYNYEWLQLFTSYLTIHLLMFCIQCIVRTLYLSSYYCLQLWITLHCFHWNACHYWCEWYVVADVLAPVTKKKKINNFSNGPYPTVHLFFQTFLMSWPHHSFLVFLPVSIRWSQLDFM
jgi:hypothetical protein